MMFLVRRSLWQRTTGEPVCERFLFRDSISADRTSWPGMSSAAAELERKEKLKIK